MALLVVGTIRLGAMEAFLVDGTVGSMTMGANAACLTVGVVSLKTSWSPALFLAFHPLI
jgi:hypothetical protein